MNPVKKSSTSFCYIEIDSLDDVDSLVDKLEEDKTTIISVKGSANLIITKVNGKIIFNENDKIMRNNRRV